MAVLAALLIGLAGYGQWTGQGVKQDFGTFGAPFKLASTKGSELDSQTLSGKPYGIFFGFTHCPEVCPTTLFEMSASLKELGENAKDFRLLFITIDPERDTLPLVKDYLSNFDPRIEGLVPTLEQLPKLARDWHIYYKKEHWLGEEDATYHVATPLKKLLRILEPRALKEEKVHPPRIDGERKDGVRGAFGSAESDHEGVVVVVNELRRTGHALAHAGERGLHQTRDLRREPGQEAIPLFRGRDLVHGLVFSQSLENFSEKA